ncbi:MAG: hypothetical protein EOP49_06345 [Sphingobacteriales bacterium]|nr:MAG: hypothetical protein EOP49_06345 [Sphingobacteriales bacterium]
MDLETLTTSPGTCEEKLQPNLDTAIYHEAFYWNDQFNTIKTGFYLKFASMRTGLIIADFEMSFATSFKHTARVKWGVDFENSHIPTVQAKLHQLKEAMQNNPPAPIHVGWEITLEDVERVEALLLELLNRWKQSTNVPPHPKLYKFLNSLRELEAPTVAQQVKEVTKEIFKPELSPKLTKKQREEASIEAIQQQIGLNAFKRNKKKR